MTPTKALRIKLNRCELRFLRKAHEQTPSRLDKLLADKVPEKLQSVLNKAFFGAFQFVFDKGMGVIEKSYKRERHERMYKSRAAAFESNPDRTRLGHFQKAADIKQGKNVVLSAVKGAGLGLLGIGIPDIPLFIVVLLRGICEIALNYGFGYESEEERYFILRLISTALSSGEAAAEGNQAVNRFISYEELPENYERKLEIQRASELLSNELLYMKFLQGIPLVGVIGGLADASFTKRILSYAKLKYAQRFLLEI